MVWFNPLRFLEIHLGWMAKFPISQTASLKSHIFVAETQLGMGQNLLIMWYKG